MLSYGLVSDACGLLVPPRSISGDVFLPRLALRRRSAARENRPVRPLSVSLRPRLWLIVEFRVSSCCGAAYSMAVIGALVVFMSSSITISMTPEFVETPEIMECVLVLP